MTVLRFPPDPVKIRIALKGSKKPPLVFIGRSGLPMGAHYVQMIGGKDFGLSHVADAYGEPVDVLVLKSKKGWDRVMWRIPSLRTS